MMNFCKEDFLVLEFFSSICDCCVVFGSLFIGLEESVWVIIEVNWI